MVKNYNGPDIIPNTIPNKTEDLCFACFGRLEYDEYFEVYMCHNCGRFKCYQDKVNICGGSNEEGM